MWLRWWRVIVPVALAPSGAAYISPGQRPGLRSRAKNICRPMRGKGIARPQHFHCHYVAIFFIGWTSYPGRCPGLNTIATTWHRISGIHQSSERKVQSICIFTFPTLTFALWTLRLTPTLNFAFCTLHSALCILHFRQTLPSYRRFPHLFICTYVHLFWFPGKCCQIYRIYQLFYHSPLKTWSSGDTMSIPWGYCEYPAGHRFLYPKQQCWYSKQNFAWWN